LTRARKVAASLVGTFRAPGLFGLPHCDNIKIVPRHDASGIIAGIGLGWWINGAAR
jgi:hypothetical protein